MPSGLPAPYNPMPNERIDALEDLINDLKRDLEESARTLARLEREHTEVRNAYGDRIERLSRWVYMGLGVCTVAPVAVAVLALILGR